MYKNFFGFSRNPFELSPDPSFICPSEKNNEALALISYAISQRKGFVVLTGEVGTGKTLMLRCLFESWRREGIAFANIFAPRLSVMDFLSYAASDLGIETAEPTKGNLLRAFYAFVSAQSAKGLTTVLVIDEAHRAPTHVLEEIRMLTNVETDREKLVQVLLVGQPELDEKLDLFELRQLKQRIAVRCHLEPLREEETHRYIEERLRIAGAGPCIKTMFPPETLRIIYRHSRGIPRIVNSLCDQALIAACAQHLHVVSGEIVEQVASRFRLTSASNPIHVNEPGKSAMSLSAMSLSAMSSIVPGNPRTMPANSVGVVQEPQEHWIRRCAVVVSTVWQNWRWPTLPKRRVLFSAAGVAVVIVFSVASAVLFRMSRNTLAYSVPRRPEIVVSGPRETARPLATKTSELSTSATGSDDKVIPLPKVTQSGNKTSEEGPRRSSTGESDLSVSKLAQSDSKLTSNLGEGTFHRAMSIGNLSKPIAKIGRPSNSSGFAPTLGAQEILSPVIDIRSLGSALGNPPTSPGGHLQDAKLISAPPPIYPSAARDEHIVGVVVIDALVDAAGKVQSMTVISGPPFLTQSAMDALRTWKYEPARLNDQPVAIHTQVRIDFGLR